MTVHWQKSPSNTWYKLRSELLNDRYFDKLQGIYIIWYWDDLSRPRVIQVGQGIIRNRVQDYLRGFNFEVANHPALYITWTVMEDAPKRDAVLAFLGRRLRPGGRFPHRNPIPINLPEW